MTTEAPLITVGIPARPATPAYFRQSLESVVNQTYKNIEILIADDASESIDVEREVRRLADGRIRYHRHNRQIGLADNFTWCVRQARGEWLTIFHDDDIMLRTNIANMIVAAQSNSAHQFQLSQVQSIDGSGMPVAGQNWFAIPIATNCVHPGTVLSDYLFSRFENRVCMPSVFVRRDEFLPHLPFSLSPTFTTDLNMWLRILNKKGVKFLIRSDTGIEYRFHPKQATATLMPGLYECLILEFGRMFGRLSLNDKARYLRRIARYIATNPTNALRGVLRVLQPADLAR